MNADTVMDDVEVAAQQEIEKRMSALMDDLRALGLSELQIVAGTMGAAMVNCIHRFGVSATLALLRGTMDAGVLDVNVLRTFAVEDQHGATVLGTVAETEAGMTDQEVVDRIKKERGIPDGVDMRALPITFLAMHPKGDGDYDLMVTAPNARTGPAWARYLSKALSAMGRHGMSHDEVGGAVFVAEDSGEHMVLALGKDEKTVIGRAHWCATHETFHVKLGTLPGFDVDRPDLSRLH